MPRRAAYPLMLWTFAVTALTFMAPRAPKTCCAEFCPCKGRRQGRAQDGMALRIPRSRSDSVLGERACLDSVLGDVHVSPAHYHEADMQLSTKGGVGEQQRAW